MLGEDSNFLSTKVSSPSASTNIIIKCFRPLKFYDLSKSVPRESLNFLLSERNFETGPIGLCAIFQNVAGTQREGRAAGRGVEESQ